MRADIAARLQHHRHRLWVVDPRNQRLSVFAEDFAVVADRTISGQIFSAYPSIGGSTVLVSGFMQAGNAVRGVARIALDAQADVFGGAIQHHPNPRVQVHMVAAAPRGEVWTVAISGWSVNILASTDLSLLEKRRLPGDELAQEAPARLNVREERPVPQVSGIMAEATGPMWVTVGVADREWAPSTSRDVDVQSVFDTRVLAIDPTDRAVVATTQLDDFCLPVDGGRVSCVDEPAEAIRIVELEVEPRGRR
jgi:hypothetical protein